MAIKDRLSDLADLPSRWADRRAARLIEAETREVLDKLGNAATNGPSRGYLGSHLGSLAELYAALGRLNPTRQRVDAERFFACESVCRVLADVELAVVNGGLRQRTATALEPLAGDVLNRMAATADLPSRLALLPQLQHAVGPDHPALPAIRAVREATAAGAARAAPSAASPRGAAHRGGLSPSLGPPRSGDEPGYSARVGFRPPAIDARQQPTSPGPQPPQGRHHGVTPRR